MAYLMGIDVGTTGTKTLLIAEDGTVMASATEEYPLHTPRPNWSEQDPEDWWRAVCAGVGKVLAKVPGAAAQIAGIGLSGQMHGAVFLDEHHRVIRPAILWNDQRTGEECAEITSRVGATRLMELASNPALTGFTAPKILWLRKNEPHHYERVRTILLPKDYVRFRLTGTFATEVSDASGTLLFDVKNRRWSKELLEILDIPRHFLPECAESPVATAKVSRVAAEQTGLREGTPVVGGGGDQAAGAVGTGVVSKGVISSTLGTSGVVFAYADKPETDPQGRLHTFCHAVPGAWHMMGVMLSAGGSLRWFRDALCHEEIVEAKQRGIDVYELLTAAAAQVPPGAEGLLFLPYLAGERTPYPDPNARGVFIGLSLRHTKAHMVRAVLEGVTFGMRDSLEIMRAQHIEARQIRASGGGGRSALWRQIQADVFGAPVSSINVEEGPAFGVALLAGVGTGIYATVPEACQATIRVVSETTPRAEVTAVYERYYRLYRSLYPLLRDTFRAVADLVVS
ncbi:MAG: xylulokinase [candidate division KSB1 bacterium]|nr:xylulokinase [candidate division KSB1 bacterium]MDZ7386718.1 xylulokinase [candidate division KSB1 bacterium]